MRIALDPAALYFFDPESGANIAGEAAVKSSA
jgi:hypothetical protein